MTLLLMESETLLATQKSRSFSAEKLRHFKLDLNDRSQGSLLISVLSHQFKYGFLVIPGLI